MRKTNKQSQYGSSDKPASRCSPYLKHILIILLVFLSVVSGGHVEALQETGPVVIVIHRYVQIRGDIRRHQLETYINY